MTLLNFALNFILRAVNVAGTTYFSCRFGSIFFNLLVLSVQGCPENVPEAVQGRGKRCNAGGQHSNVRVCNVRVCNGASRLCLWAQALSALTARVLDRTPDSFPSNPVSPGTSGMNCDFRSARTCMFSIFYFRAIVRCFSPSPPSFGDRPASLHVQLRWLRDTHSPPAGWGVGSHSGFLSVETRGVRCPSPASPPPSTAPPAGSKCRPVFAPPPPTAVSAGGGRLRPARDKHTAVPEPGASGQQVMNQRPTRTAAVHPRLLGLG